MLPNDVLAYEECTLDDLAAGRERLSGVGHVVVRGALPVGQVSAVRDDLKSRIAAHCEDDHPLPASDRLPVWSSQAFHALGDHPQLRSVITALTGWSPVSHPKKIFRHVERGDDAAVPTWHQDWPEVQGDKRSVIAWVPFLPVGPDEGALVVHGEPLSQMLPPVLADTSAGWAATVPPRLRQHCGEMKPGDVLVFSLLTLHRGGRSVTRTRFSCDFRFSPADSPLPVNATTLNDRDYDWDDVYRDWTPNDLPRRHYWKEHAPGLLPYDAQYDDWRNAEALRRGEAGDPAAVRGLEFLTYGGTGTAHQQELAERILAERFGFYYE